MRKKIYTVCLNCGNKNKKKHKQFMGCWIDTCDMCGDKNVRCASAQHDFGIYNSIEELKQDKIQDLI